MKRALLIIGFLAFFVPTAHAATVIGGEQINRVWPLTNNNGQSGLEILGTLSGTNLYATKSITGADLYSVRIAGGGLTSCATATSKLLYNASTKQFSCGTDQGGTFGTGNVLTIGNARYLLRAGGTLTGATTVDITGGHFNTVGLKVINTLSGASLHAERTLTTSGSLVFEGAASGSSLYLGTSLTGVGLVDCDTAATSKLLWNASSGRFLCGTDQTGGGSTFGTGNVLTIGDARYVRRSGSTMTGQLVIDLTSGFYGLKIVETASGNVIHAEKGLTSSGTLTVKGEPRIPRIIAFPLCDAITDCATGSGIVYRIPTMMDNFAFSGATLDAGVAGTTSTMSVQVINITDGTSLFTTKITLDSGDVSSDTAATPYVRNGTLGQRTITDGDRIMPRIDAVHTTPAKGVTLNLHFIPL
jgi:hypothetical protein